MTNLGNKEVFAKNLSRYMQREGFTVSDLSDKISTPYSTVADWTKAKTYPRIDKIEMMARLFGIEKSDLIEEKPIVKSRSPQRRFLMDQLDSATDEEVEKLAKLWDIVRDEEEESW